MSMGGVGSNLNCKPRTDNYGNSSGITILERNTRQLIRYKESLLLLRFYI